MHLFLKLPHILAEKIRKVTSNKEAKQHARRVPVTAESSGGPQTTSATHAPPKPARGAAACPGGRKAAERPGGGQLARAPALWVLRVSCTETRPLLRWLQMSRKILASQSRQNTQTGAVCTDANMTLYVQHYTQHTTDTRSINLKTPNEPENGSQAHNQQI